MVTRVDAGNGAATQERQPEAVRQAAVGDRLLPSGTDIADADRTSRPRTRLWALNPGALLRDAIAGDVPASLVLAAGPYDSAARHEDVVGWLHDAVPAEDRHHDAHAHHAHGHHGHGHPGHGHDPNRHDSRTHSFCLTSNEPPDLRALATWFDMITATRGESLLRVKGLLNLAGEDRPVVLHVFHHTVRLKAWPPGDDRRSRFVLILRAFLDAGAAAQPSHAMRKETTP